MKLEITDVIHGTEAEFWALYLDPVWIERMLVVGLEFRGCQILKNEDTATGLRRELKMTPKLSLPDAVVKIVGPSMVITEDGTFDRGTQVWSWRHKMSVMTDKFLISGTIRVVPDGPNRCTRHSDVTFECKLFGVGGLVEKAAASNIRAGFITGGTFINKELAAKRTA